MSQARVGCVGLKPELMASAYALIYEYMSVVRLLNTRVMVAKRPPTDVARLGLTNMVANFVGSRARELTESLDRRIESVVGQAMLEWRFVRFIREMLGPKAALAFVASPPTVTLKCACESGPALKPHEYIQIHFIPTRLKSGKVHRPVIARYFYRVVYLRMWKLVKEHPVLQRVFETSYKRDREKVSDIIAKRRALRDATRVIIGCTWLIGVLEAVEEKKIAKPSDIVLPRPEKVAKMLTGELVNPGELLPEFQEYTWKRLLKLALEA